MSEAGNGPDGSGKKPTPVRELSAQASPIAEPTDVDETTVEIDEAVWTVRVLGRSRSATAGTPLLLLGFYEDHDDESGLEILVPARLLSELGDSHLRSAHEKARPPLEGERPLPFFADGGRRRRR